MSNHGGRFPMTRMFAALLLVICIVAPLSAQSGSGPSGSLAAQSSTVGDLIGLIFSIVIPVVVGGFVLLLLLPNRLARRFFRALGRGGD